MVEIREKVCAPDSQGKPSDGKIEQPVSMKIIKIIDEAKDIKTFFFKRTGSIVNDDDYLNRAFGEQKQLCARPGQFVLLWLPRINMKPFGISYLDKEAFAVTVCKVGTFTEILFQKKAGDVVGVMGPYGNGFDTGVRIKNTVLIAGGYGVAPLAFLADELANKGTKVRFIIGAKSECNLLFRNRFKARKGVELTCMTDDGSFGEKGYTTEALKKALEKDKSIDMIYTCGPEIMMKKVIEISDIYGINCQVSMERYMKCGFGVCGQCCCDSTGDRVCKEGPVFPKEYIQKNITEFGSYKRDGTGTKILKH